MRKISELTVLARRKHDERRGEMATRFIAIAATLVWSLMMTGEVRAQANDNGQTNPAGFVMGDPSGGKLIPIYEFGAGVCDEDGDGAKDSDENSQCFDDDDCDPGDTCITAGAATATLIGVENTILTPGFADDIFVHLEVFDKRSNPKFSKTFCLTQGDFGFIVLQNEAPSEDQEAERDLRCGPDSAHPRPDPSCKVTFLTNEIDGIPAAGYVTLSALRARYLDDGTGLCCDNGFNTVVDGEEPAQSLYAWAVLQDVGEGFFATEIPVVSAGVNFEVGTPDDVPCGIVADTGEKSQSGDTNAIAGTACLFDTSVDQLLGDVIFGLIPGTLRVGARYDCNPANDSETQMVVWQQNNREASNIPIILRGEDEGCVDSSIDLPDEVNIINVCDVTGVPQLATSGQFRGALEFITPQSFQDGLFLFSLIRQADAHHVLTQLPYNTGESTDDGITLICPGVF
jgi:hypothetical protein